MKIKPLISQAAAGSLVLAAHLGTCFGQASPQERTPRCPIDELVIEVSGIVDPGWRPGMLAGRAFWTTEPDEHGVREGSFIVDEVIHWELSTPKPAIAEAINFASLSNDQRVRIGKLPRDRFDMVLGTDEPVGSEAGVLVLVREPSSGGRPRRTLYPLPDAADHVLTDLREGMSLARTTINPDVFPSLRERARTPFATAALLAASSRRSADLSSVEVPAFALEVIQRNDARLFQQAELALLRTPPEVLIKLPNDALEQGIFTIVAGMAGLDRIDRGRSFSSIDGVIGIANRLPPDRRHAVAAIVQELWEPRVRELISEEGFHQRLDADRWRRHLREIEAVTPQ